MTALTIDTNALKDRVTQTVINQFAALIPDEVFAGMVDEVVQTFFTKQKAIKVNSNSNWNNAKYSLDVELTPFQVMVWKNVQELVADKLDEYFDTHKNALKAEMGKLFDTPRMNSAVAGNVAMLTHALSQVQQLKVAEHALIMMQSSLQNVGRRMDMPELANLFIPAGESNVVDHQNATVK